MTTAEQYKKQLKANVDLANAELAALKAGVSAKEELANVPEFAKEQTQVLRKIEARAFAEALLNKGYSDEQLTSVFSQKYPDLWEERSGVPKPVRKAMEYSGGFMTDWVERAAGLAQFASGLPGAAMKGAGAVAETVGLEGVGNALETVGEISQIPGKKLTEGVKAFTGRAKKEMGEGMGINTDSGTWKAGKVSSGIVQAAVAGEAASRGVIGALGMKPYNELNLLNKSLLGAVEGFVGGTAEGAGRTGKFRPLEAGLGTVLGAAAPAVIAGAGAGVKAAGRALQPAKAAVARGTAEAMRKTGIKVLAGTADDLDDVAAKIVVKRAQQQADDVATRFIKPAAKKTGLEHYVDTHREAVDAIMDNKGALKFVNEAGEEIAGELPENMAQYGEAIRQAQRKIYSVIDDQVKAADKLGAEVDYKPIVAKLKTLAGRKGIGKPERAAAQELIERLSEFDDLKGTMSQTDDLIVDLNRDLRNFYSNQADIASARVKATVATDLRASLDDGVSKAIGENVQPLKNQYGALTEIRKGVEKAIWREAKKSNPGLIDMTDIFTGGDIFSGLVLQNPYALARGIAGRGVKQYLKYLNNPNRAVNLMFKYADDAHGIVKKAAEALYTGVKQSGGATITLGAHTPKSGFVFSQRPQLEVSVPLETYKFSDAMKYTLDNLDNLNQPNTFLGAWTSGGKVVQDVSTVLDDAAEAMRIAANSKQLAIWDLAKSVELPVKGTAGTVAKINFGDIINWLGRAKTPTPAAAFPVFTNE